MADRCQLGVDHLGAVTGNHVEQMDGIEGVLPVNDEKRRWLVIEEKILTQETPDGEWFGLRCSRVVTEGLDVADGLSLNRHKALEGRTRIHPDVMVYGEN